jgi:transposase-like protein
VDETRITVNGKWLYLYRALDHEGNLLDVRLSEPRDLPAARDFFRSVRLLTKRSPLRISSYRHGSDPDAIWLGFRPAVIHYTKPYANHLLEQDHRQVKQRTRPMQRFWSLASAERSCQAHNEVRNFLRFQMSGHHLASLAWQRCMRHHQLKLLHDILQAV